jgi:hypothetical protein
MIVTKEAKQFYSMLALLKCAEEFKAYLMACDGVHGTVKHEMKGLFNRLKLFQDAITKDLPRPDKEKWEEDWKRDFLSFSAVFEKMSEMTDEQRDILELAAEGILKNEIIVEHAKPQAA